MKIIVECTPGELAALPAAWAGLLAAHVDSPTPVVTDSETVVPAPVVAALSTHGQTLTSKTCYFVSRAMAELGLLPAPGSGSTQYVRLHGPGHRAAIAYVHGNGRIDYLLEREQIPAGMVNVQAFTYPNGYNVRYYLRAFDDNDLVAALELLRVAQNRDRGTR